MTFFENRTRAQVLTFARVHVIFVPARAPAQGVSFIPDPVSLSMKRQRALIDRHAFDVIIQFEVLFHETALVI